MNTDVKKCWKCGAPLPAADLKCENCCAANETRDPARAEREMDDFDLIEHVWVFRDDSFAHEFGTERIKYWQCDRCGKRG